MRKIIGKMLRQFAVYWPITGADSRGKPTWGPPIELPCRWEDTQDTFQDSKLERLRSEAVVYLTYDVEQGGVLMLGELTSSIDSDPKANPNAWEISKVEKVPSLQVNETLRVAYLSAK